MTSPRRDLNPFIALCVLSLACSDGANLSVTPDGAISDAALAAANDDVQPEPAVCTVGADQTCNENPAISTLYGRCLPDRTCACQSPFTKNPATGKCVAAFSTNMDGGADAGPAGHPNCQAFCQARQINIQKCAVRNGDRNLRETYEGCIAEQNHVERCFTGPSCGGWLGGCLDDSQDAGESRFPPGSTCAQSVANGLFRP